MKSDRELIWLNIFLVGKLEKLVLMLDKVDRRLTAFQPHGRAPTRELFPALRKPATRSSSPGAQRAGDIFAMQSADLGGDKM